MANHNEIIVSCNGHHFIFPIHPHGGTALAAVPAANPSRRRPLQKAGAWNCPGSPRTFQSQLPGYLALDCASARLTQDRSTKATFCAGFCSFLFFSFSFWFLFSGFF